MSATEGAAQLACDSAVCVPKVCIEAGLLAPSQLAAKAATQPRSHGVTRASAPAHCTAIRAHANAAPRASSAKSKHVELPSLAPRCQERKSLVGAAGAVSGLLRVHFIVH